MISPLNNRRVSQERVLGISFVDILIQAVFVLLVALMVGYVDPVERLQLKDYAEAGKDLCHKLNKDSPGACREYVEGKEIGVVTHGQGLWWLEITLTGKDAHTGSTPMNMRVNAANQVRNITGCYVINEERLNNFSDSLFLDIRHKGYLPAIYAHLLSLPQIERLVQLQNDHAQSATSQQTVSDAPAPRKRKGC